MKKKTKEFISLILVIVLIAGIAGIVTSQTKKETKEISTFAFEVGGIDAAGEHVDSKTSLYTPELFECRGLNVVPDFEYDGTYTVYLYNLNKEFIASSGELSDEYTLEDDRACFARIQITPEPPAETNDFKLYFYDVYTYASQLTINVSKDQSIAELNLFKTNPEKYGKKANVSGNQVSIVDASNSRYDAYLPVGCERLSELTLLFESSSAVELYFVKDTGSSIDLIKLVKVSEGKEKEIFTIPTGANYLLINYVQSEEFEIYKTK